MKRGTLVIEKMIKSYKIDNLNYLLDDANLEFNKNNLEKFNFS